MNIFRNLFRRRLPDWKMVHDKLYKLVDWHNIQRDKATISGEPIRASEHQVSSNVLLGIAQAIDYGMYADEKDFN